MPKANVYADEEVATFLNRLPRHLTFSEMAAACLERFGAERAWSRSKIIRYWEDSHPVRKGRASRVDLDDEVRAFLNDLVGRQTLKQLVAACQKKFGLERSPSRSTIHRYWQRVRRERAVAARRRI